MSTLALSLTGSPSATAKEFATARWPLMGTAIIFGIAFFLAGHDLNVSLAEAYTQNAEEMEMAAAGGNSARRVALLLAAGWGATLLVASNQPVRLDPLLAGSLALLFALVGVSFVWADDPGMCLRRLFALVCCLVAALGAARSLSFAQLAWLAILVLGGWAAVGLLAELRLGTFRPWAGDYRFAGTVHPNTQGPGLAAMLLAAVALARRGGRFASCLWLVAGATFALLLLTKSRTTAAGVVVSLLAVGTLQMALKTRFLAAAAATWLAITALWLVDVCGFDPRSDFRDAALLGRAEESETLSGRAFIWPEVLDYASQRPILGYGYEAFWTPARIEVISADLGWGLREAHNAYLEILLWLGVIGLAALLLVAIAALVASIRSYRASGDPAHTLTCGLLVFAAINAGFESGMIVINFVPLLLGCCVLRLAFFRSAEPVADAASIRGSVANVLTDAGSVGHIKG
jgi:O-antigen ligase